MPITVSIVCVFGIVAVIVYVVRVVRVALREPRYNIYKDELQNKTKPMTA